MFYLYKELKNIKSIINYREYKNGNGRIPRFLDSDKSPCTEFKLAL